MNVYRSTKTGRRYKIYKVSPRQYTGSWFEAVDIETSEKKQISEDQIKKEHKT